MSTNEKLRLLFLITSPKMAKKAEDLIYEEPLPFVYSLNARGTATSEVMDILGLGSAEKGMIVALAGKSAADAMLLKLHKALKIGTVNSGIAYTIPLDAASKIIFRTIGQKNTTEDERKEQKPVSDKQRAMIVAVVNLGYSEEVMDAARAAGAGGGTVVHSRSINDDAANAFGTDWSDEKDIVMIAASAENKLAIMQAISEKCGALSEAHGIVFSLPIENVIGLSED